MRANLSRRRHERSRRSPSQSFGRPEIRQILSSYYLETRPYWRRRLTFQESLRVVSTMTLKPVNPDSFVDSSSVENDPLRSIVTCVAANHSNASNVDALSFSSIAAASTAVTAEVLDTACGSIDTREPRSPANSTGNQSWIASPTSATSNSPAALATLARDVTSITDRGPLAVYTVIDTNGLDATPSEPNPSNSASVSNEASFASVMDCAEPAYAYASLRGKLARVLTVTTVLPHAADYPIVGFDATIIVSAPGHMHRPHDRRWSPFDVMAKLEGLRSDTGGMETVFAIFPPLESLSPSDATVSQEAILTRSLLSNVHSRSGQGPVGSETNWAELACGVDVVVAASTQLRFWVRRAVSSISGRLGFRGSPTNIRRSLSNQLTMMGTTSFADAATAIQVVVPTQLAKPLPYSAETPITLTLPERLTNAGSSWQMMENWVSLPAA